MFTWRFGLFIFIVATTLSVFLTPLAARMAVRADAIDHPTHRKRHGRPVPLWGGLGLWLSLILTLAIAYVVSPSFRHLLVIRNGYFHAVLWSFLSGSTLAMGLGLIDDRWGMPPKVKLAGQAVAAVVTVWGGVRVWGFVDPFFHEYVRLPVLAGSLLAFFWIILIMNAINFMDGLDGLASGIALISAAAFFVVSLITQAGSGGWARSALNLSALLAVVLAGVVGGFLVFNFHPAKIFLGDSGSLFLGHALASIALIGSLKSTAVLTALLPLLIMGLPLADVFWAIVRRLKAGQPISKADKGHVHHRLLALGWSHRGVVLMLYGLNVVLGGLAVWLAWS